jgi:pimeloyl-ACP methyl ester carboxylesterase
MPFAEFDGTQVHYKIDGQGPPLVVVHGTAGNSEADWALCLGRFTGEWTVLRPEYAGSGETTDDGRSMSVEYLAGQVIAAAEHAGAVPFHLVGFSLGAGIGAWIAAERPELVRSLTLLGAISSSDDPRLKLQFELWRDLIRTDRRAMVRLLVLTGFSPEFVSGLDESGVATAVEQGVRHIRWDGMARQIEVDLAIDIREQIKRIAAPTLVIGCTYDQIVPLSLTRDLALAIPGATYAELAAGHIAPVERPDEFAELVTDFLRAQQAAPL